MTKTKKALKEKCPTCQKTTSESGHLCVPRTLSHKNCDWCGAFIPNARHLCKDKIKEVTYICNSCGRTAVKAEFLCQPKKIK
jgi:predicted nucleic acid-binding Zn ribbon protein